MCIRDSVLCVTEGADFNPRGPHGPRPGSVFLVRATPVFQSTRPSRTSTSGRNLFLDTGTISIHEALTDLDDIFVRHQEFLPISIHEALTDLDKR